jgi:hypothetical protein
MKGRSGWHLCFLHCQNNASCKVVYVVHFTNCTSGVWNETKLYTIKHNHYTYKTIKLQATNSSYIKQYSNQSWLTEYSSVVRLPLPT